MRILNNVQPNFNYSFGFPATPSYTPAPVYQQPSIQPWHYDMAQSQQTLFQGWAGFGGASFGGGFSASAGFGGSSAFGGVNASAFASLSAGTNSTDLSSVFGSMSSLPSFGLAGGGFPGGGGAAFGSDPFSAGLQNIERQMFALAGNFGASGGGGFNPLNNPFSAGLQQVQMQLAQLAFTPQPTPFFQPRPFF